MDDKTMTNEENYRFDVAGYMIVPGVLTAAELNACNQALDQLASNNGPLRWTSPVCNPLRALREHPVLMQYLEQICGEGVRVDESPRLVESCTEATDLSGGDEWVIGRGRIVSTTGIASAKGCGPSGHWRMWVKMTGVWS